MGHVRIHQPSSPIRFVIVLTAIVFGSMALSILGVAGMVIVRRHQATKMAHDLKIGNARPKACRPTKSNASWPRK